MASKNYTPDPSGIRDLARDSAVGAACVSAAQAGLSFAERDDPDGHYTVRAETVPAGWSNEQRAGAVLEETEPSRTGAQRRTLVRSVSVIEAAGQ